MAGLLFSRQREDRKMNKTAVTLVPLQEEDREQFIRDNQWAFKYGSTIEFGMRNDEYEKGDEIILFQSLKNFLVYKFRYSIKIETGDKSI